MSLQHQLIVGALIFTLVYVAVRLYRKEVKANWEKLIAKTSSLNGIVVKDVKLSYIIDTGGKYLVSPFNRAEIHLFDDFLLVFRQQDLLFLLYYKPLVLCKQLDPTKKALAAFEQQAVEEVKVERFIKGEIEITWADKSYKRWRTTVTLKNLSQEQVKLLSVLKTWV